MGYLINTNAKNVWVRDHADTMDLPVQTDANSVYFNNGRTMEQEFGKGAMVSNVATVESRMDSVVEGTYDGAYESGVMYGKTMVNVTKPLTDITIGGNGNYNGFYLRESGLTKSLKTNTDYLFVVNVKSNTLTGSTTYSLDFGNTDPNNPAQQTYFVSRQHLPYNALGIYKFVMRTRDSFDGITIVSRNQLLSKSTGGNITFDYTILEYQQGMENWDIPFFTGLCDVKMPILKTVGRNLFNPINIFYGSAMLNDDNTIFVKEWDMGENGWKAIQMNCTPLPSGTYYVDILENGEFVKNRNRIWVRNSSRQMLANSTNRTLFTINEPATQIDLVIEALYNQTLTNATYSIHIEKANELPQKDIPYEAYKTNILETSNDLVLRGLPSGIRDTYDCLTGEYIRRVGERDYQESDESDSNVITDLVKTHYELAEPIVTQIEPPTTPFAYENGHIILESGHEGQSLLPTLEYQTVVSRSGQVAMIDKTIQQHERKITLLEKMLVQNIIDIEYKNTLLALKLEINEVI